ncbi:MAG: hypothetical protein K2N47_05635 [Clostridia bacterium]|nr:hypothetical protein [Clostridia bacterium]
MTFDIIDVTEEEVKKYETIKLKLLRTAQQKKNELQHKMENTLKEFKRITYTNGTQNSTIYAAYEKELKEEFEYQVEILREQLLFNMSLREPTSDGETGNDKNIYDYVYVVDYELSYVERYIIVRDYYLSIGDYDEMIALYQKDTVAMDYLGIYYTALFDYIVTLDPANKK